MQKEKNLKQCFFTLISYSFWDKGGQKGPIFKIWMVLFFIQFNLDFIKKKEKKGSS